MKIKKRFVAFMMAILMVLTSITIQYRKSEAATVTATITVNFDAKDENKTVKVTVGDKSFEETVTKSDILNEDGTASGNYKYQVTGDLEVETGDKTAVVTYDNGNSVYSAQTALTIPDTPDPTTNKYAVETGVVTLLLTTVKEVTVTGVDGYTFTSVTGATRVGDTWKFTKTDGFKVGQDSFTINANDAAGNEFKATIAVSGESVGASWEVVGFKSIKINLPEGYESCGLQTGSNGTGAYKIKDGVVTTISENLIAPGAQIAIVAYKKGDKNGLKYETTVTVGNSANIVVAASGLITNEFYLEIDNRDNSNIRYKEENATDWIAYSQKTKLDANKSYILEIKARQDYRILDIEGIECETTTYTQGENGWKQKATAKFGSNNGKITVSEHIAQIKSVTIDKDAVGKSILPDIALPIAFTVSMEAGVDQYETKLLVTYGDGKSLTSPDDYTWDGSKLTLNYNERTKSLDSINVVVRAKNKVDTNNYKDDSISLNIKKDVLIEDQDYTLDGFKNKYAVTNGTGNSTTSNVYYSTEDNKKPTVHVYGNNYSQYKYDADYKDIVEGASFAPDDQFELLMRKIDTANKDNNKFGYSIPMKFIQDDNAPIIKWNNEGSFENKKVKDTYSFKEKDVLRFQAKDGDGSGVEKVYYYKDNDTNKPVEIALVDGYYEISASALEGAKKITVYGVDHVGNIGTNEAEICTIKYDTDFESPKISVTPEKAEEGDYFYTYEDETKTYYFSKTKAGGNKKITVEVTDKKINQNNTYIEITAPDGTKTRVEPTEEEIKNNPKKWTYSFDFGEKEGTYTVNIVANDVAGNTESNDTFKVIVDNTAPEIDLNQTMLEPVALPGEYADQYIAYNQNSSLKVIFSDKNIAASNAVDTSLPTENPQSISYEKDGNKYTATWSFANVKETYELDKTTATVTVTDKAGNSTTKNITYAPNKTLVENSGSKTIVVVKTSTKLAEVTADTVDDENVFKLTKLTDTKEITGIVTYAQGNYKLPKDALPFLQVHVMGKNSDGEYTDVIDEGTLKDDNQTGKYLYKVNCNKNKLENENTYKIKATYCDIASYDYASKNDVTSLVESPEYVYDNVAPVISEPVFSNENGTITYTLTEKHPDFGNFAVSVNAINNENNEENEKKIANDIAEWLKGVWISKNGTYTKEIKLPAEGKYTISITPIDKATNEGTTINGTYVYDKTAPTLRSETAGVPTVEVKTAKETKNTDYSKFDETKAVVTVHAYDLVADSLKKSVFTLKDSTGKVITVTGDKLTEKKEKGMFTESFEIDPNFKGSLSFVLEDSNKNVSDEIKYTYANGNLKGIVVEDGEKHESVSEAWVREVNASAAENGIYNEDIKLNLYAEDMYSGLSSVSFVAMNKDDGAIIAQYSEDIESRTENSGVQYTWNKNDQVISALKKNEGNNIELWFSAQDNAGHKINAETKTVKIDVTAPKVTVTYDNNSPVNEKYFNATRTATIEVKDYNFISSGITLDIKKNGAPMNVAPNFSTDRVVKKDESGKPYYTYVMTLPFAEDGDYDFTVSARDAAGNVGTLGRTDSFTIDKTNPDMSIAFDNNNPYSGQYYGDSRTATITIKEHNFNASDVKVNVTASVDGSSVSAPSVSAFSTSGDVHTASVTFNGDADYTISASCVDLAGNEGNNIEEQSFTVDQTAPEIKITGVKADESYTGSVSPVVTVTDGNYDTEGVTVNIVGGKHGKSKVSSSVSDIAHGQTYSFADLQHTQDNDDYYTLTAKAVDKAGHETEETIAYKVNRFGSVYVMNDALQAAVDQYYATSSDKYAIIEQNVDELDSYTVSYSVDNEIVNLEENKGYKVSHKTNKEDWQEYEYKLDADTFSKEGVYNISISSKDTAGNASDNKSKNVEMEFCIDNTKPSCIISGVEENQKFDKGVAANIVVEAYDNIKFGDMQISVNGSQIKSEKDMTDGKVSFTIDPAKGDQTLKVVCHDAAGNETVQEIHFTFNMGVLNSGSPVAIIIIVIAVAAAAAVISFLIAKKKKNGK